MLYRTTVYHSALHWCHITLCCSDLWWHIMLACSELLHFTILSSFYIAFQFIIVLWYCTFAFHYIVTSIFHWETWYQWENNNFRFIQGKSMYRNILRLIIEENKNIYFYIYLFSLPLLFINFLYKYLKFHNKYIYVYLPMYVYFVQDHMIIFFYNIIIRQILN